MIKAQKNSNLNQAKTVKNDEFYTLYKDVEKEIYAYVEYNPNLFKNKTVFLPCDAEWSNFFKFFVNNFEKLGLKTLIASHHNQNNQGKTVTITKKNLHNHKWTKLQGNGDFRSSEVTDLRNMADFVITNPPFSLFREFIRWLEQGKNLNYAIIGNKSCITYKEVFPLIKANKAWSGFRTWAGGMWFETIYGDIDKVVGGVNLKNIPSIWITTIKHNRRYEPILLNKISENLNKNPNLQKKNAYMKYDNYNAIEVPLTKAIPSDYNGIMGVPISFLDKFNPNQFELIGATESEGRGFSNGLWVSTSKVTQAMIKNQKVYKRIFIKAKEVEV